MYNQRSLAVAFCVFSGLLEANCPANHERVLSTYEAKVPIKQKCLSSKSAYQAKVPIKPKQYIQQQQCIKQKQLIQHEHATKPWPIKTLPPNPGRYFWSPNGRLVFSAWPKGVLVAKRCRGERISLDS